LRQIEYDAGLAYQSLISCVETISNDVLQQHLPDKAAMIKAKESVYKMASRLGLKQEQCEDLAIEACSGMSWTARKFKKFLIDNIKNDFWEKDDLFQLNELFCPKQSDLESVISTIYAARGGATHGGQPYPSSITIGIGPTFPTSALLNLNLGQPCSPAIHIPPVVWFERLVNYAINSFIKSITMSDRSLNGEIERTSKDSK